jgi:hypothetical protein
MKRVIERRARLRSYPLRPRHPLIARRYTHTGPPHADDRSELTGAAKLLADADAEETEHKGYQRRPDPVADDSP